MTLYQLCDSKVWNRLFKKAKINDLKTEYDFSKPFFSTKENNIDKIKTNSNEEIQTDSKYEVVITLPVYNEAPRLEKMLRN